MAGYTALAGMMMEVMGGSESTAGTGLIQGGSEVEGGSIAEAGSSTPKRNNGRLRGRK